jgi:hypothetical protein
MSKQTFKLSKTQGTYLDVIKRDEGSKVKLEALAKQWGTTYPKLYAIWNYRLKKKERPLGKNKPVSKPQGVVLYILEDIIISARNDKALRIANMEKLVPSMRKMEVGRYALNIHRADKVAAMEVATQRFPRHKFGFTNIAGNNTAVRMYRKA